MTGVGMTMERRTLPVAELRVAEADEGRMITGYAAVFDQLSEDLGGFRELIRPGAFRKVIKDDVRALVNHDANFVLGRNVAGTLRLAEDDHGLQVEIDAPDTAWARDLMVTIDRGDVDQMSFAFSVREQAWKRDEDDGAVTREIIEFKRLYDVSVVTFPAYPQTEAQAREIYQVYEQQRTASQEDADPADGATMTQERIAVARARLRLMDVEI